MNAEDLSQNPRIARLTRLRRELGQSQTAQQTMRALERGFSDGGVANPPLLLSTRGLPPGHYRVVPLGTIQAEPGPVRSGGILAAILSRDEPQLIQDVDCSQDPVLSETLKGVASLISLPLSGDRLPMNWLILLKKAPDRFTVTQMEEEIERTALAGSLLENQILADELARANRQIEREARNVGELQRALLPVLPPRVAGLEIAASYEPSGRAGGDLYDFFPLDESPSDQGDAVADPKRWCVFIADTAGHSLAAAVVMSIVQAVLRAHPPGMTCPASLLTHANRQLCSKELGGFVTAFLGVYEPKTRRLTYANAGHPPPLVRRASDGTVYAMDRAGSHPMGIQDYENFDTDTVQLEPGDMLLLYTDGITEARGPDGELFETDRLVSVLRDGGDRPADIIDHARASVRTHQKGEAAKDDQTLVAARIL